MSFTQLRSKGAKDLKTQFRSSQNMLEQYEAISENYKFIRGEEYSEGESDSVLWGKPDCTLKQVFLKKEGDSLWGGYGEWADSSDLGKLEDIAKNAGVQSPSKFFHEYDDKQLELISCYGIDTKKVDETEVYLPIEELIELRDFEKRLETEIADYRKLIPLETD